MSIAEGVTPVDKSNTVTYNELTFDPDFLRSLAKGRTVYSDGHRDYVIKDISIPHPDDKAGKTIAVLHHLGINEPGLDFPVFVDLVEFLTRFRPTQGSLPYKLDELITCEFCKQRAYTERKIEEQEG